MDEPQVAAEILAVREVIDDLVETMKNIALCLQLNNGIQEKIERRLESLEGKRRHAEEIPMPSIALHPGRGRA